MAKPRNNPNTKSKPTKPVQRKIVRDPETGLMVLSGPKITKEDIIKDFPEDSDRDAIILRRSVGL